MPGSFCDLIVHSTRLIDANGTVENGWVATRDRRIIATGSGSTWHAYAARDVVSGGDCTLVPGFIDLHCHGAGGASFDEGPANIQDALAVHRAHGTTRSVLSLVSAPIEDLCRSLSTIADLTETDPLIMSDGHCDSCSRERFDRFQGAGQFGRDGDLAEGAAGCLQDPRH